MPLPSFRFRRRRKSSISGSSHAPPSSNNSVPYEPYFGDVRGKEKSAKGARTDERVSPVEKGEQVLLHFIKNRLGMKAEGLVIRLLNKNPIKDGSSFTYQINQSTEGRSSSHYVEGDDLTWTVIIIHTNFFDADLYLGFQSLIYKSSCET